MEQLSFDDPEAWKPVVGWEGLYEVSDHGRVRSLPRQTPTGLRGGKMLRPETTRGYLYLNLSRIGHQKHVAVARLVASAFAGACPPGMEVRHLDGNPPNNRWAPGETEEEVRANGGNLFYGTHTENNLDQIRHGTNHQVNKTHCPQGHEYTPENTRVNPRGHRRCLTCQRDNARRKRARQALRIRGEAA